MGTELLTLAPFVLHSNHQSQNCHPFFPSEFPNGSFQNTAFCLEQVACPDLLVLPITSAALEGPVLGRLGFYILPLGRTLVLSEAVFMITGNNHRKPHIRLGVLKLHQTMEVWKA